MTKPPDRKEGGFGFEGANDVRSCTPHLSSLFSHQTNLSLSLSLSIFVASGIGSREHDKVSCRHGVRTTDANGDDEAGINPMLRLSTRRCYLPRCKSYHLQYDPPSLSTAYNGRIQIQSSPAVRGWDHTLGEHKMDAISGF